MKKLVTMLVLCLIFVSSAIGFVACGMISMSASNTQDADIVSIYNIYVANAESNGITPLSYEQWLASIKGEKGDKGDKGEKGEAGKDGRGIEKVYIDTPGI